MIFVMRCQLMHSMHKVMGGCITAAICRFGLQAASNVLLQYHIGLLLPCADYVGSSQA